LNRWLKKKSSGMKQNKIFLEHITEDEVCSRSIEIIGEAVKNLIIKTYKLSKIFSSSKLIFLPVKTPTAFLSLKRCLYFKNAAGITAAEPSIT